MAVVASQGVGEWFLHRPEAWLVPSIMAAPVVVVVDLHRRKPRRILRHLVATAAAMTFVSLSFIPNMATPSIALSRRTGTVGRMLQEPSLRGRGPAP